VIACIIAASAAASSARAENCIGFPGRAFAVGVGPASVAIGDMNGDTIPDLAAANSLSNDVSILLGTGEGKFAKAKNFPIDGSPQEIVIADFDADSKLDVMVRVSESEELVLLFGDGLGSFAASKSIDMGIVPWWLFVRDLNGDAKPDIVVADKKKVMVRIAKGGGTFKAHSAVVITSSLTAIAVGDLNGDSTADLALARIPYPLNSILACLGDGLGGFSAPIEITGSLAGHSIAIGDVTGDAIADLVIGPTLSFMAGVGGGAFASPKSIGASGYGVTIADLNRDGTGDLVAANGNVSVIASKPGTGLFAAPAAFPAGLGHSPVLDDLDGDGNLDVVVANSPSDTVTILRGNGEGALEGPTTLIVNKRPRGIVAADFNADSKVDFAFVTDQPGLSSQSLVSILLGDGSGGFAMTPIKHYAGTFPGATDVADVDRDGKLDLVVADTSHAKVWILRGNGAGGFAAAKSFASVFETDYMRIGDFNGDDVPDVAVSSWYIDGVAILFGDGAGGLGPPAVFVTEQLPSSLALGDLNGDGKLDFATTSNKSTRVTVRLGDVSGGFGVSSFVEAGTVPKSAVIDDLNGDAKSDIVTAHRFENEVSILWGEGTGKFSGQSRFAAGPGKAQLAVADFDADGYSDLFALNWEFDSISVLRGKGSGEFAKLVRYATDRFPNSFAIADLNADGLLDLSLLFTPPPSYGLPSGLSIRLNQCSLPLGKSAAQTLSYGSGKQGAFGVPKLTSTPPRIGSTATLSLSYLAPVTGLLLVGLDPIAFPFDGGTLLVDPIVFAPLALVAPGTVSLPIPVPAVAALSGSNVYMQAMFVDPLASGPYDTAQSAGLRWVIGY
jgi:FG-GAP-like repeat/FG-GAP repeat